MNLYGFVLNNPINSWDYLGMVSVGVLQAELELLRDELERLEREVATYGWDTTSSLRAADLNNQIERVENQLGQLAQGADGGNPADALGPFGPPGSPTDYILTNNNLIPTWSSNTVPLVAQPIHQIAIDRALSQLTAADRDVLRQSQVLADSSQFQTPENSFRHAMRDGRVNQQEQPMQTIAQARAAANGFVRDQILTAQRMESEGNHAAALREFGLALHTLQDSTSPAHAGFQPWGGPDSQSGYNHFMSERTYPGDDSALFRITQQAWAYYSGATPLPDDFFPGP